MIKRLLVLDASKRIGGQHGACDIKEHAFFHGINFSCLLLLLFFLVIRNITPPMIPQLDSPFDTKYFPNLKDDDYIARLEEGAKNSGPGLSKQGDPFNKTFTDSII